MLERYEIIQEVVNKINWPKEPDYTDEGKEIFNAGIDKVDGYLADLAHLLDALGLFRQTQSAYLANVGIAYTIFAASQTRTQKYHQKGVALAQEWLNKAKTGKEDDQEILVMQMFIDANNGKDLEFIAHRNLVEKINPNNFHAHLAALNYKCKKKSLASTEEQYEKTIQLAKTKNQQFQTHWCMAQHYLFAVVSMRELARFVKEPWRDTVLPYAKKGQNIFKRLEPLVSENTWYWHSYCMLYFYTDRFLKAARYNKKALKIEQTGRALEIKRKLLTRMSVFYYLV